MSERKPKPTPEEVIQLLDRFFDITHKQFLHLGIIAAKHGLTAPQATALRKLAEPVPMSALAQGLACDPSNVTGLIDRIERLGFVERTLHPSDRRVRLLALTAAGKKMRDKIEHEMLSDGSPFAELSAHDVTALSELLRRLDAPSSEREGTEGTDDAPPAPETNNAGSTTKTRTKTPTRTHAANKTPNRK